jgi:hypothetical protein
VSGNSQWSKASLEDSDGSGLQFWESAIKDIESQFVSYNGSYFILPFAAEDLFRFIRSNTSTKQDVQYLQQCHVRGSMIKLLYNCLSVPDVNFIMWVVKRLHDQHELLCVSKNWITQVNCSNLELLAITCTLLMLYLSR